MPAQSPAGQFPVPTRRADRRLQGIAFCVALVVHGLVLLISFPEAQRQAPHERRNSPIVVKRYVPPPPPIEPLRVATTRKRIARRIPIPDPTPDAPEPIRESVPEILSNATVGDVEMLIGEPLPPGPRGPYGPPGSTGPRLAGVGGATLPVRIEASYVQPAYPEIARIARIEAHVILQAVVSRDGTVADTKVLRCSKPAFGFETAAIAAVRQWRYEPATQNGQPVSVYFTILVDFQLL